MTKKIISVIAVFIVAIGSFFLYQNAVTNKSEKVTFDQSFPEEFKKIIRKDQLSKIQIAVTNKTVLGKTVTLFAYNKSYAVSITKVSIQPNFLLKKVSFDIVKKLEKPLNKRFDSPYASGFPFDFQSISGERPILKNNVVVRIQGDNIRNLMLSDSMIESKFNMNIFSISDDNHPLYFVESAAGQLSFDLLMLKKDDVLYIVGASYMQNPGTVDSFSLKDIFN